ncbi:hypothetical protein HDE_07752 [Halotydeus destructor]|nr:hypothetical protein HDE_07752 [Halotydeus destructor]
MSSVEYHFTSTDQVNYNTYLVYNGTTAEVNHGDIDDHLIAVISDSRERREQQDRLLDDDVMQMSYEYPPKYEYPPAYQNATHHRAKKYMSASI